MYLSGGLLHVLFKHSHLEITRHEISRVWETAHEGRFGLNDAPECIMNPRPVNLCRHAAHWE